MGKLFGALIKKPLKLTIAVIVILLILIALARAREDYWYQDSSGRWIRHGNPASNLDR